MSYKKNIILILFIRIAFSLLFAISVITLFWKKYGLNLFDIFWLQAIFSLSVVIFEVPTGYIADILGRKKTLMMSLAAASAGWILYSQSKDFYSFVFVEILLGIAFSLLSGTDTALLYESLAEINQNSMFTKISGRQTGIVLLSETAAALAGGITANFFDIKFLFYLSALATFIGFILSFFIKEPEREVYSHPKGTIYGFYKILRFVFLKNKTVRYSVILFGLTSTATMLGVWLYQEQWQSLNIPVWLFGALWSLLVFPAFISSFFAYEIEKFLGKKNVIIFFIIPPLTGYVLAAFLPGMLAVIPIYAVNILRGLNTPIITNYINRETHSNKRATVLSIASWIFRISYFVLGPLVGLTGNRYGVKYAFILSALLVIIILIPAIFLFLKKGLPE